MCRPLPLRRLYVNHLTDIPTDAAYFCRLDICICIGLLPLSLITAVYIDYYSLAGLPLFSHILLNYSMLHSLDDLICGFILYMETNLYNIGHNASCQS